MLSKPVTAGVANGVFGGRGIGWRGGRGDKGADGNEPIVRGDRGGECRGALEVIFTGRGLAGNPGLRKGMVSSCVRSCGLSPDRTAASDAVFASWWTPIGTVLGLAGMSSGGVSTLPDLLFLETLRASASLVAIISRTRSSSARVLLLPRFSRTTSSMSRRPSISESESSSSRAGGGSSFGRRFNGAGGAFRGGVGKLANVPSGRGLGSVKDTAGGLVGGFGGGNAGGLLGKLRDGGSDMLKGISLSCSSLRCLRAASTARSSAS